ncbi:hypothetical protein [Plantibacter sp. YIM 135347]|uniref:hypothetical protein n=1 Tax=Plantibacter sp. YIM 135347 TaxID=3423919 RepID=UPI003D347525
MELVIGLLFMFVPPILAVVIPALFALSVLLRKGPFAAKSRLVVVTGALYALVSMLLAYQLVAWSTMVSPLFWLIPVALFATGVGGTVAAWTRLPSLRAGAPRAVPVALGAINVLVAGTAASLVLG